MGAELELGDPRGRRDFDLGIEQLLTFYSML